MFEASQLQHNSDTGYITVVSDGHYVPAFWAHPQTGGAFPGLVLLHDRWGLTPHIRAQARRFAEQGYYVIAPDLFNRQQPTTHDAALGLLGQIGEAALAHVASVLHALKEHHRCNGRLGVIGWGSGGALALRTGLLRDDLGALISFYGLHYYGLAETVSLAELRLIACPLLAIFAGHDPFISAEQVERLRAVLDDAGPPHAVRVYPGTEREFFDDSRAAFHAEAAADAWARALAFANRHLGADDADTPGDAPAIPPDSASV